MANLPINVQRGAFLQLVKNNINGIATHFVKLLGTNPKALNNIWANFGGDITTLKTAIIEGAKSQEIRIGDPSSFFSLADMQAQMAAAQKITEQISAQVQAQSKPAASALNNIAAQSSSYNIPAQQFSYIPPDNTVAQSDYSPTPLQSVDNQINPPQQGNLAGSIGGFMFKANLLFTWHGSALYINNPTLREIAGIVAIGAPLIYLAYKKLKQWQTI